MQDDIKVMDHEIQHDIHIQTPLIEKGKPVGFHEHGIPEVLTDGTESRVKTFEVPDLQDTTLTLSQSYQVVCLVNRLGHGLFQKDVYAGLKEVPGDGIMKRCRRGNAYRVNATNKLPIICGMFGLKLTGNRVCTHFIQVGNGNQPSFRKPCILL
jgi:hypothetical protein